MRNDPASAADDTPEQLLDALTSAYRLKDEPRRGWVLRGVERPESVAAHSWGTALLCLALAPAAGVDAGRALAIATVHDLPEAEIGDIPNRAGPEQVASAAVDKSRRESEALDRMLAGRLDPLRALWAEYEQDATPEARFVRDMNLVDMALQALVYEEQHRYDPGRPHSSRSSHGPLDEFFASAESRAQGEVARDWLARMRERYERARLGRG